LATAFVGADRLPLLLPEMRSVRAEIMGSCHPRLNGKHRVDKLSQKKALLLLTIVISLGFLVRMLYFTGMSLGDDVFYTTQALSFAQTGRWSPEPYHWHTRLGVILPATLSIKALGARPVAFVLWPLLASTASILVCYLLAHDLVGSGVALIAAIFQAAFPLEVIYSTHLFPDVLVALFSTLSLWCWISALRSGKAREFLASGAFISVGYLCRETVVMEAPVYVALWFLARCPRHARMLWILVAPVLVVSLECGLYGMTSGSPFYRWNAILAQQRNPDNLTLVRTSVSGGDFWTDPLFMIATNHEFGLYHAASLAIALFALWRWTSVRPLAIWLLVGFAWTFYGTTVPTGWVSLQRDPRYAASLTVPAVILLAYAVSQMSRAIGWLVAFGFVGSGLFAAGLDQGHSILIPHRAFVETRYANQAILEPFEYVGARWVMGLSRPPGFACASDRGRRSLVRLLGTVDGATMRRSQDFRYFAFSPQRRPELVDEMGAEGWIVVETIPGQATPARAFVAELLERLPSQRARAERIAHPPSLLIMQNPRVSKLARESTNPDAARPATQ